MYACTELISVCLTISISKLFLGCCLVPLPVGTRLPLCSCDEVGSSCEQHLILSSIPFNTHSEKKYRHQHQSDLFSLFWNIRSSSAAAAAALFFRGVLKFEVSSAMTHSSPERLDSCVCHQRDNCTGSSLQQQQQQQEHEASNWLLSLVLQQQQFSANFGRDNSLQK